MSKPDAAATAVAKEPTAAALVADSTRPATQDTLVTTAVSDISQPKSADPFLPPIPTSVASGAPTFVVRIPLTTHKKALLSQLFDSSGETLKDYMPYDQQWPARMVKGSWFNKPRISIPLLPPRAVIVSSKLVDVLGELDKFVKKKSGLSLNMLPQKDLKSSKCIIALVSFSILANILVAEREKPSLIQALSNYVAFTQAIQRQILEAIIDQHPVEAAVNTITRKAFDPRSLSILAILTSLEREAKKRQAEMYAKLANQLFPPIDEIKDCLKRLERLLFSVFVVAHYDAVPDDDLLNRLFDPNPSFIHQHKHDETAGLDEDSSQILAAEMKRDGFAYALLVEKRDEISRKLSQATNVHVLEWATQQTFTRFVGFNTFITKIIRAAKAKSSEKPLYIVFMHAFELCTSLFLSASVLEQVVEKFDTAVSQLANLTAHVASAPIAACTEALAELKRRMDNFAATLTIQCSEAYGMARRSIALDLVGLSVAADVDQLTQKQAAQLLRLESLGEVVATPIYLLKILKLKDICGQVRAEASKLVPYVNKLREAADVITALENILGIISNVKDFNVAASNAVGKPLPLDLEPLEVLKRKLAARAPIVQGLRTLERQANNLHSTYSAADPAGIASPPQRAVSPPYDEKEEKFEERSLLQREGSEQSMISQSTVPDHCVPPPVPPPLPPRTLSLIHQQIQQDRSTPAPNSGRRAPGSPIATDDKVRRSTTTRVVSTTGDRSNSTTPGIERAGTYGSLSPTVRMFQGTGDVSPNQPGSATGQDAHSGPYGRPLVKDSNPFEDTDELSEASDDSTFSQSFRRISTESNPPHSGAKHGRHVPGAAGDGCAAQCEQNCTVM